MGFMDDFGADSEEYRKAPKVAKLKPKVDSKKKNTFVSKGIKKSHNTPSVVGPSKMKKDSVVVLETIDTNFDDSVFSQYDNVGIEDRYEIRVMLRSINFGDSSTIMNFGDESLKELSGITSALLSLSETNDFDIEEDLDRIKYYVTSVNEKEVLNTGFLGLVKKMFSLDPSLDSIKASLTKVEMYSKKVESKLPDLIEHIKKIEKINKINHESMRKLNNYIIACKIAIDVYSSTIKPKLIETKGNMDDFDIILHNMDFSCDALQMRLNSLLNAKVDSDTTFVQIQTMMTAYAHTHHVSKDIILGLVTTWKSYCATLISHLSKNDNDGFGEIAGDLMITKDKIVKVIDDNV